MNSLYLSTLINPLTHPLGSTSIFSALFFIAILSIKDQFSCQDSSLLKDDCRILLKFMSNVRSDYEETSAIEGGTKASFALWFITKPHLGFDFDLLLKSIFLKNSTFSKEIFQFSRKISSKNFNFLSNLNFYQGKYQQVLLLCLPDTIHLDIFKFEQELEFLLEILGENWKISFENVLLSKNIDFTLLSHCNKMCYLKYIAKVHVKHQNWLWRNQNNIRATKASFALWFIIGTHLSTVFYFNLYIVY